MVQSLLTAETLRHRGIKVLFSAPQRLRGKDTISSNLRRVAGDGMARLRRW